MIVCKVKFEKERFNIIMVLLLCFTFQYGNAYALFCKKYLLFAIQFTIQHSPAGRWYDELDEMRMSIIEDRIETEQMKTKMNTSECITYITLHNIILNMNITITNSKQLTWQLNKTQKIHILLSHHEFDYL